MDKIVSNDQASDHVSSRQIYSPLILNPPLESSVPPAPIEKNLLLLTNQAAPMPTSNRYADLYSSDSVFEEMVDSKTLNPINTYSVVALSKATIFTPHNVLKNNERHVDGHSSQL